MGEARSLWGPVFLAVSENPITFYCYNIVSFMVSDLYYYVFCKNIHLCLIYYVSPVVDHKYNYNYYCMRWFLLQRSGFFCKHRSSRRIPGKQITQCSSRLCRSKHTFFTKNIFCRLYNINSIIMIIQNLFQTQSRLFMFIIVTCKDMVQSHGRINL